MIKGKAFIIDDDPLMGNVLEVKLSEAGFEAEYFSSGEKALERISKLKPDIIISDIIMPEMDGYELHRTLRQDPATAGIPFVFMSAKTDLSDQLKGWQMGVDDYVCKPFKIENLLERIETVMERAAKARGFRSQSDFSGNLAKMNLNDVLQVVELNYKSGELVLNNSEGEKIGRVLFRNGKLINADSGILEGKEAFFNLMDKIEGFFDFYSGISDEPEIIQESNREILLEGTHLIVESTILFSTLTDLDVMLDRNTEELLSEEILQDIGKKTGDERLHKILALIDKYWTAREIINSGEMSRLRAASVLSALLDNNLITASESKNKKQEQGIVPDVPLLINRRLLKELENCEKDALTGILKMENILDKAAVYLKEGSIIHAYHGKSVAKKAINRIFSEKDAAFQFLQEPVNIRKAIDDPLNSLADEANRELEALKDLEDREFKKIVSINSQALEKAEKGLEPYSEIKDHQGINYMLSLVKQHSIVKDIIDSSQMTDLHTYNNLLYMSKIGILRIDSKKEFKVQLITDSTADIPADIIADRGITQVHLSSAGYPILNDFGKLIKEVAVEKDILAVFASGKMSKAFEYAMVTKEMNYDDYQKKRHARYGENYLLQIEIIDSKMVSLGIGMLVLEAADKIENGWRPEQISDYIKKLIPMVRVFFVPGTSDNLKRETGTGKTKTRLRNILGIRQILSSWDGELVPIDQVRGEQNAYKQVVKLVQQGLDNPDAPIKAGIVHSDASGQAEQMRDLLKSNLNCQAIIMSQLGPMVGLRCGQGTVGVVCLPVT
ncbi:MAG: DegV family EDD domain-containing protein [Desulfobacterales bacterium]|nr:DegV family EDD domain-containing protein [Desulfobacterales bacterium]